MRRGDQYVASLRDGRAVFLDGAPVDDVTVHPAFRGAIARIAGVYDRAGDPARHGDLTSADPRTGERISNMWLIPKSADDLRARRRLHRFWAEGSYGLMGRTPDHVASFIAGFAASRDVFDRGGTRFGDHVVRFYEHARREDLYLTYVIVPPQVDRSKPAHQQPVRDVYPTVVKERDDGIVLRGAQMIGTSAVMADGLLLTYIVPLEPGDEDHAISVFLPCNAPGLRLYPRRPYATMATSVYDYPLSSRFDETDSLIVLRDVFVPWEHVFVYRDVRLVNAQFFETGSHLLGNFQALVRFVLKLRFAAGLAKRLADLHNIAGLPPVQAHLGGEIAAYVTAMEAIVGAAESSPWMRDDLARPNPQFVYAGMCLQRRWVVDLMRALREVAGGAFLSVPSSDRSFASPETGEDTRQYYQSAGVAAEERIKLVKLMWDFVGTEFAGRQLQYEMFYSAAKHVVDSRAFRFFDWAESQRLVDACLAEYDLAGQDVGLES
ncbi:MAG TPA: 4-hydroxyphenylacetate 3-hydroxylase N-terminal domain-containing protein [bacterium]|nr:4-hydroxyphenylacetate 3-hydroxylase N-terminal domain-containing protein [bacterium]